MKFESLRKEDFELIKSAMLGHATELVSEALECEAITPKEVYERNMEQSDRLIYLVNVLEGAYEYDEKENDTNYFLIVAKDTIEDQFGNLRLMSNKEYVLLNEYEDSFCVIDETGGEAVFDKERFYEIEED